MVEIEFVGGFSELLGTIEKIIVKIVTDILCLSESSQRELGFTKEDMRRLESVKPNFPRVTYDEAIKLLNLEFGKDISAEEEQRLVKQFDNQPVLLTHAPNSLWDHGKEIEVIKFFNMLPDPVDQSRLLAVDLILPTGGEALGGAERITKAQEFEDRLIRSHSFRRLQDKGGSLDDFEWYLKILRVIKEMPQHAGGGFGVARILKFLRGESDIRNVVPFSANRERIV